MFEFNFDNITEIQNKPLKEAVILNPNQFSIQVDRNSLLKAISHVQNIVDTKSRYN